MCGTKSFLVPPVIRNPHDHDISLIRWEGYSSSNPLWMLIVWEYLVAIILNGRAGQFITVKFHFSFQLIMLIINYYYYFI